MFNKQIKQCMYSYDLICLVWFKILFHLTLFIDETVYSRRFYFLNMFYEIKE